jgi:hypothetical protein
MMALKIIDSLHKLAPKIPSKWEEKGERERRKKKRYLL